MAVRAVSRDIWEYIFDYVPDDAAKLTLMKSVTVDWNLCLKKKWDKSMLVLRGPCVNCDSQKENCGCIHTHYWKDRVTFSCTASARCKGPSCTNKYPCLRKGFICERPECASTGNIIQYVDREIRHWQKITASATETWIDLTKTPQTKHWSDGTWKLYINRQDASAKASPE